MHNPRKREPGQRALAWQTSLGKTWRSLGRRDKATASPGREVKASRVAGCPEPGGTSPCRSGTSSCHTRGKRPAWRAGRSSGSPAEGSASPAWCDTSGNRPAYPTPLLGNLEPAVLMAKHTHFQGYVKRKIRRMGREYEH